MGLDLRRSFDAVDDDGRYAPQLKRIRGRRVSGVYAIIDADDGAVLYVGESHTGRLYDTITRHFRSWTAAKGREYVRELVRVAFVETRAGEAQELQYLEIDRLAPEDNEVGGYSLIDELPV